MVETLFVVVVVLVPEVPVVLTPESLPLHTFVLVPVVVPPAWLPLRMPLPRVLEVGR